jgi:hypothetical protein
LVDGKFDENPANGQEMVREWQNQIKMIGMKQKNYGIRPMGPKIFRASCRV